MKRRNFLKGLLGLAVASQVPVESVAKPAVKYVGNRKRWGKSIISQPKVREAQKVTNEMLSEMARSLDAAAVPTKGRHYWDPIKQKMVSL